MSSKADSIFLGSNPIQNLPSEVAGEFVEISGESFYKISNYHAMDSFFMTVVSPSDQWLFIASNGGLTAGRKNAESSLFPYYTDDKIVDNAENTGSKTLLKVKRNGEKQLWEAFSLRSEGLYRIRRNLYKNALGNKLRFEEVNESLGLSFSYEWSFSNSFGFVKKSWLKNLSGEALEIEIVDGLQNILPSGVNSLLQNGRSTLVDAYKKNELIKDSSLAIYSLSARIVDKAEPAEALRANTIWSSGLKPETILLSSLQLDNFRRGIALKEESFVKATKGAYFIQSSFQLEAAAEKDWCYVAELNQSSAQVAKLIAALKDESQLLDNLNQDIELDSSKLKKLVGLADGLQTSKDQLISTRHYSNVLFNIMRGGIFENVYELSKKDLLKYFNIVNHNLSSEFSGFFEGLDETLRYDTLVADATKTGNSDLLRICREYLPLSFSRRHGDPSRPWNYFSIENLDQEGNRIINYEGNWRDIFQNWEALSYSFPLYIEGIIAKFVNASTLDGYNPYRISKNGIDWEVIEEHDPWSFIGYWGDHQIIYLQKLLEHSAAHFPEKLQDMLGEESFVYANVPYRIKSYPEIVKDPSDTIDFDHDLELVIQGRVEAVGSDGRLVWDESQEILKANLTEKILLTALTKLYNFIPETGIWLNTQRPEWNDANNALVGNGVSMVTLYYLRRFLAFNQELFGNSTQDEFAVHSPLYNLAHSVLKTFDENKEALGTSFGAKKRRDICDSLGYAGDRYRAIAYTGLGGEKQNFRKEDILHLFDLSLQYTDDAIAKNRREDGLYHAYNLIEFKEESVEVSYLYEMLEGQVAALSTKNLKAEEALNVLDRLKQSEMYRPDQYSYMLYPDRELAPFVEKNNIPQAFVENSGLIKAMHAAGNESIVEKGAVDSYHFNGDFSNGKDLSEALELLEGTAWGSLAQAEAGSLLDLFEEIFNHRAFTGRSGTFYGYEGLGSIYWHMVSKLLLAVQENILKGKNENADPKVLGALIDHYYEIRAGIGANKNPKLYGAFPTDAYSHTPSNAGVQQPGMTGQVKEDVLNRWAELGLTVNQGQLSIDPFIMHAGELVDVFTQFEYVDQEGNMQHIELKPGQMAFSYCGLPIIYESGENFELRIYSDNGQVEKTSAKTLSLELSQSIFSRNSNINHIELQF
jgi:hypothetical protein